MPKQNNKNKMTDELNKKQTIHKINFYAYIYSVNVYPDDDINMVEKS